MIRLLDVRVVRRLHEWKTSKFRLIVTIITGGDEGVRGWRGQVFYFALLSFLHNLQRPWGRFCSWLIRRLTLYILPICKWSANHWLVTPHWDLIQHPSTTFHWTVLRDDLNSSNVFPKHSRPLLKHLAGITNRKDIFLIIPTIQDVVKSSFIFNAWLSWHNATLKMG